MKTTILYIGKHPEILAIVVRLLNANDDWYAIGSSEETEAESIFRNTAIDLVLLGCGIEQENEDRLRTLFMEQNPDCKIIQHYGGGSGLLRSEILSALAS